MLTETIGGTTYTYTYDKVGNLTSYNGYTLAYTDSAWPDRLSTFRGYACYYDGMGNITSWHNGAARWEFTWDGRELTSAVKKGTGYPSSYTYDENGLRTTKTVVSASGTSVNTYLYDTAGTLLRQIVENPDGTTDIMEFMYDESGRPYAVLLNSTIYYYILNLQGDVVQVADSWGRAHATYTYNAWGKLLSAQAGSYSGAQKITDLNPLRYRGYYYDTDTQLYYLQSRYYDPNLGRHLTHDTVYDTDVGIQGFNLFVYYGNNPV